MSTTDSRSLPRALADETLATLIDRLRLEEVLGPDGGPYLGLSSQTPPAPVGWVRVFHGATVQKVVNIGITVPHLGMDSHMIFAFTGAESAIPHFTLDAVLAPGMHAFHLDLIPRADLAAHLGYMDVTLGALTETFTEARQIEGLSPARLTPRQIALMSPWMLAFRATEEAFAKIRGPVSVYLQHWLGLLEKGLSPEILADLPGQELALRDRRHRASIFNPEVDPVWSRVERLVGTETGVRMREILMAQDKVRDR
jgi:hypothetical protein